MHTHLSIDLINTLVWLIMLKFSLLLLYSRKMNIFSGLLVVEGAFFEQNSCSA